MARDMNKRTGAKGGLRLGGATGVLAFAAGLALGLLAAFFVYLRAPGGVPAPAAHSPPVPVPVPVAPAPAAAPAPVAAAPPASGKPKFDFYTILPEMEVKVPEYEGAAAGVPPPAAALDPGAYVLQVGSYQRYEDADRAKAELALQGITANIEEVAVSGGDTWYRVRVGPLAGHEAVQAMRSQLTAAGLDFILLRIRPDRRP